MGECTGGGAFLLKSEEYGVQGGSRINANANGARFGGSGGRYSWVQEGAALDGEKISIDNKWRGNVREQHVLALEAIGLGLVRVEMAGLASRGRRMCGSG